MEMSGKFSDSAFIRLRELAGETSSDKRRELLRSVTDIFLGDAGERSETECLLFGDVVSAVAQNMENSVRAELADKLADTRAPIRSTLLKFAKDDIEVARKILERSTILTEDDLLDVVSNQTQAHMLAVTKREDVTEKISTAIVDRGSDAVVASLLENDAAVINRESMEKVADRAHGSKVLQKSFVSRDAVPLDLLNELMQVVEKDLRKQILRRVSDVSEEELEAALSKGRTKVQKSFGKATRERQMAIDTIDEMEKRGTLKHETLLKFLQQNNPHAFGEALSRMSGIGHENALKIYRERDVDSLALVMKAMEAKLPVFATTAAYIAGASNALNQVQRYAGVYKEVPVSAAQRALRFWKIRDGVGQAA